jgi:hypothetical protein
MGLGTGTPSWLYYLFASLMLAVAAYCLASLALSVPARRASGRDVDVAHTVMGVTMAGLFVGSLSFGPNAIWELVFAALLVWFAVHTVQSVLQYGPHVPHHAIHATMSLAMLLMYWFPMGSQSASSMSSMAGGSKLDPGLGLLLAFMFFGSAIFTLASPNKGASHHGTHVPQYAMAGPAASTSDSETDASPVGRLDALLETPWLEDASHAVMCVAMGFMLILML